MKAYLNRIPVRSKKVYLNRPTYCPCMFPIKYIHIDSFSAMAGKREFQLFTAWKPEFLSPNAV